MVTQIKPMDEREGGKLTLFHIMLDHPVENLCWRPITFSTLLCNGAMHFH